MFEKYNLRHFSNIFTLVACSPLKLPNSVVSYDGSIVSYAFTDKYSVDTVATFSCNPGYSLSGSSSSICQDSGTWDPQPPTCGNKMNQNILKLFSLFTILKYYIQRQNNWGSNSNTLNFCISSNFIEDPFQTSLWNYPHCWELSNSDYG